MLALIASHPSRLFLRILFVPLGNNRYLCTKTKSQHNTPHFSSSIAYGCKTVAYGYAIKAYGCLFISFDLFHLWSVHLSLCGVQSLKCVAFNPWSARRAVLRVHATCFFVHMPYRFLPPCHTFCRGYDWSGKKVYLFASSGGSGIGKSAEKLQPYIKGAQIAGAVRLESAREIRDWAMQVKHDLD